MWNSTIVPYTELYYLPKHMSSTVYITVLYLYMYGTTLSLPYNKLHDYFYWTRLPHRRIFWVKKSSLHQSTTSPAVLTDPPREKSVVTVRVDLSQWSFVSRWLCPNTITELFFTRCSPIHQFFRFTNSPFRGWSFISLSITLFLSSSKKWLNLRPPPRSLLPLPYFPCHYDRRRPPAHPSHLKSHW